MGHSIPGQVWEEASCRLYNGWIHSKIKPTSVQTPALLVASCVTEKVSASINGNAITSHRVVVRIYCDKARKHLPWYHLHIMERKKKNTGGMEEGREKREGIWGQNCTFDRLRDQIHREGVCVLLALIWMKTGGLRDFSKNFNKGNWKGCRNCGIR